MNEPVCSLDQAIATLREAPVGELQERGYHFQKRDYYSALNDLPFLAANRDLWHDRPFPQGIVWDLDAQLETVRGLARYFPELGDVPYQGRPERPEYHWDNDFWRDADALVQYGLLRGLAPRRVVEIGSGWSSLLMARALGRNEADGGPPAVVDQVEPYPRTDLLHSLPAHWTLHETTLQRAPLELFDRLRSGDVCFYDGSHVARAGSDVVWFFFEVLPRLAPGVLVHVHDVFWPADYPDEWIFERGQTWNEQYLLQAFLMYNDRFELRVCNAALARHRGKELDRLFAETSAGRNGVSVWMRRTETPARRSAR